MFYLYWHFVEEILIQKENFGSICGVQVVVTTAGKMWIFWLLGTYLKPICLELVTMCRHWTRVRSYYLHLQYQLWQFTHVIIVLIRLIPGVTTCTHLVISLLPIKSGRCLNDCWGGKKKCNNYYFCRLWPAHVFKLEIICSVVDVGPDIIGLKSSDLFNCAHQLQILCRNFKRCYR